MTEQANPVPNPMRTEDSAAFWCAADREALAYGHCAACDRAFFYPRSICPLCGAPDTELRDAGGGGTLYSFSTLRTVADPFVLAYVTLDEGPTVLTNIVDDDPASLRIGERVRLTFGRAEDGSRVPMFRMAKPSEDDHAA